MENNSLVYSEMEEPSRQMSVNQNLKGGFADQLVTQPIDVIAKPDVVDSKKDKSLKRVIMFALGALAGCKLLLACLCCLLCGGVCCLLVLFVMGGARGRGGEWRGNYDNYDDYDDCEKGGFLAMTSCVDMEGLKQEIGKEVIEFYLSNISPEDCQKKRGMLDGVDILTMSEGDKCYAFGNGLTQVQKEHFYSAMKKYLVDDTKCSSVCKEEEFQFRYDYADDERGDYKPDYDEQEDERGEKRPEHGEHGRPEHRERPEHGKHERPKHEEHGRPEHGKHEREEHGEHGRPEHRERPEHGKHERPKHEEHGRPKHEEHERPEHGKHGRSEHQEHGRPKHGDHERPEHGKPEDHERPEHGEHERKPRGQKHERDEKGRKHHDGKRPHENETDDEKFGGDIGYYNDDFENPKSSCGDVSGRYHSVFRFEASDCDF